MKKTTSLLLASLSAATLMTATGCSSYNASQPTAPLVSYVSSSAKADLIVGEKITGSATAKIALGFIKWGEGDHYADGVRYGENGGMEFLSQAESVKSAASYNAVHNSGSDVIVSPRYEVTVHNYLVYKTIDVTVTGYKGTIASIK